MEQKRLELNFLSALGNVYCSSIFSAPLFNVLCLLCSRDYLSPQHSEQVLNISVWETGLLQFLYRWSPLASLWLLPSFPSSYNVLSSEAVILCELACGRDRLLVTIHHLSGRGDCMSDRVSGYWYDVRSERLVQGVNWGRLRWLIVCLK